jgi:hypothetical protein
MAMNLTPAGRIHQELRKLALFFFQHERIVEHCTERYSTEGQREGLNVLFFAA